MTKSKFAQGTLVRRKNKNGSPIGPWMIITKSVKTYVYAKMFKSPKEITLLRRENVFIPQIIRLYISDEMLDKIINGECNLISHPWAQSWASLCEKENFLVKLYTAYGNSAVIIPEAAYSYYSANRLYIRLEIKEVLL